jgi:hypothetical protein
VFWLVAATTSCITYKPSLCDLENLSNDAKGEDRNPWLAKMVSYLLSLLPE